MKSKLNSVLFVLVFSFSGVFSQINSVALKDASNTLLSTHSSITDAYLAIPGVLSQGYFIEIGSSYNGSSEVYPITFIAKAGASSLNTITLRPAPAVTGMTIQTSIATANNGVFKLDDADYVVVDGRAGGTGTTGVLTFNNTNTAANANTIVFINGACFNTVKYCTILNSTTSGTGRGVFLAASAANVTGNSDNLFKYNLLSGGRYQFNSNGTAANSNTRNSIFGCNFQNSTFAAFWGQAGTAKVTIDSCQFYCTAPTGSGLYFGIVFDSQKDSAIIKNNRMYDIQDLSVGILRYIHVRSIAAASPNFTEIRNNFFSMMTGNATLVNIAMIELEGTAANARVAHNSFRVGGTQTAAGTAGAVCSSALLLGSTSALSNYEVKNNLFLNERSGGTGVQHVAFYVSNAAPLFNIDYNTYNSTTDLVRWGATAYTTIAGYQAVVPGGEPNANNTAIQYVATNDLHLLCSASTNTALSAPLIANIVTDIDGQLRGAATVIRGADEVFGTPPIVASNSGTICEGDSFTITPTGNAVSYAVSGGTTIVSPTITTSYTVIGTAANGCQATAVSSVNVNQKPVISVNSGTICSGNSFTIVASGAVSYTYSGGNNIVSPLTNTIYAIAGTDANGCVNTGSSSITVNALPLVTVNSGSICSGFSFTLTPTGAITYSYSGGINGVVSPVSNTNYTVTGADANGCENTAVSSVTVYATPTIVVNSGQICEGSTFIINASGAANYTYSGGTNSVTPIVNSTYTVTGASIQGCENTALSSVIVNPLPVVSVNASSVLVCEGSSNISLSGLPAGGLYSGTNVLGSTFTPINSGTFSPVYSYTNLSTGCSNTASVSIIVEPCTGLTDDSELGSLLVFPNPNSGVFVMELANGLIKKIQVTDVNGKLVFVSETAEGRLTIDLSAFSNGVYFLKVNSRLAEDVVKLIKE